MGAFLLGKYCAVFLLVPAFALFTSPAMAEREGSFLTIYEGGFALIQEVRRLELKEGVNRISLDDLPGRIDPTTVTVSCLSAPGKVVVQEVSFSRGLDNLHELLEERFLGAGVRVIMQDGNVREGILADYKDEHVALVTNDGMLVLNREYMSELSLPKTGLELPVRPTLLLNMVCDVDGPQRFELDYIVDGIDWRANYLLVEKKEGLSLEGCVAISNSSGADYPEASFRLVSGDVRRTAPVGVVMGVEGEAVLRDKAPAYAPGVRESAFSEYHVYDVDLRVSFIEGEEKQIKLLTAPDVKAEKEYTYEGGRNARVNYEFVNTTESGLGIPLPAGRLRVYKADNEGRLLFLGEDELKQSARGEEIRVYIGDAFDIVGERKRMETKQITKRSREETYEIELRNHKDEKIGITVVEELSRNREWKIVSSSHEWKKKDAWKIEFPLKIDANGEAMVRYTVLYRW